MNLVAYDIPINNWKTPERFRFFNKSALFAENAGPFISKISVHLLTIIIIALLLKIFKKLKGIEFDPTEKIPKLLIDKYNETIFKNTMKIARITALPILILCWLQFYDLNFNTW